MLAIDPRAMALFKRILLQQGHAHDAATQPVPLGSDDKRDAIGRAATAWDMYKIIG